MRRSHYVAICIGVVVLLGTGYLVADRWFLPEKATLRSEPLRDATMPEGSAGVPSNMTLLKHKEGAFRDGEPGHHVSGTAAIYEGKNGFFLRFEDYEQTQGPDVFVYLTRAAHETSRMEVESGLRVLVPGGAQGGESTLEGDFHVPLPEDFDPSQWDGITIWCDQFNVVFGSAGLA